MKTIRLFIITILVCAAFPFLLIAQPDLPKVLDMQKRAEVINSWLEYRLEKVVPELMDRANTDMWILIAREYNEDPVVKTMLPATWQSARRRTILIFHNHPDSLERLAVSRYDIGKFFISAWNKEEQPDQWKRLVEIIEQRDPERIALNFSRNFALSDGITHSEYRALENALPATYRDRIVSAEPLAIGWLETRTPPEMEVYPAICRMAHIIIEQGFSEAAIQPGITTTGDLEWWYRNRIRDLGFTAWFHPSVSIQRAETPESSFLRSFSKRVAEEVIRPGDLLHVDFGITYLRLNTDTQQHAYVLRAGEKKAPEGLEKALRTGNRLQDLLTAEFKTRRTGNEILEAARNAAIEEGIRPSIYTHPIGFHGHGAGPTIGLWDQQEGVEGKGDYPLYPNTAYSIELNATVEVPEWEKDIRIMLEEDAFFDGDSVRYIDGRQTELWLIPRGRRE